MVNYVRLRILRIEWQGPFSFSQVQQMTKPQDRGLYQIYCHHPIFGLNTLTYIGLTTQSFSTRLLQHWEDWLKHENDYAIRVGRVSPEDYENETDYKLVLVDAERLTIFRNMPPYNSESIRDMPIDYPLYIQNYGQQGSLLHECSSLRLPPYESLPSFVNQA